LAAGFLQQNPKLLREGRRVMNGYLKFTTTKNGKIRNSSKSGRNGLTQLYAVTKSSQSSTFTPTKKPEQASSCETASGVDGKTFGKQTGFRAETFRMINEDKLGVGGLCDR
jgi:hypothetical protein